MNQLQTLLESSNDFKVRQNQAKQLADKWEASGLLEGLDSQIEKNNMARLLENQAKHLVTEGNVTGTGGSFSAGQGSQWAGIALPLVRKVFAEFAAKDFVSTQPMDLPSGLAFFLDFKYGTNTAGFSDGDNMYGNVSTYDSKMSVDEDVSGGLYGEGRFGYSINSASTAVTLVSADAANSASIDYEDGVNPSEYKNYAVDLSGTSFDTKGVRAFRIYSGSTDVTTHPKFTTVSGNNVTFVVSQSAVTVADFSASVVYHKQPADNSRGDFEDRDSANPIKIPEIEVELGSESITAKTRKLKAKWTPEFAQDLNAYQSIDAEAELTALLSDYISMEIDLEILDMLIQDAVTTERWSAENNKVWQNGAWTTATSDFYNTQGQWFQTLGTKVQKVSNKIHQKTMRGGANFLVCSPTVATIIESIPGYVSDTDGDKMDFAMGVQKVGSFNSRYRVYKNPYMLENSILLGFRGSQFLEAGAVYAPYVPLIMTPLIYDPETFTPRKGVMTRYAKKMLRPEFFGRIFISDLETV